MALFLLALALIRAGARLAGGFLAGLLLTLLAGLVLLAAVDVAGGAGGRLDQFQTNLSKPLDTVTTVSYTVATA